MTKFTLYIYILCMTSAGYWFRLAAAADWPIVFWADVIACVGFIILSIVWFNKYINDE